MKQSNFLYLLPFLLLQVGVAQQSKFTIGTFEGEGFFSSFVGVLNSLMWADRNNKTPVVCWDHKNVYYQSNCYRGSCNPWEYYFEPVSPFLCNMEDMRHRSCDAPGGFNVWRYFKNGVLQDDIRQSAHDVYKKYVTIKPHVTKEVNEFYNTNMAGKKTIGIHLRGTDSKKGFLAQKLIDEAKRVAVDGEYQFFIATDEERLLELAKEQLPRVIACNSERSTDQKPVHFQPSNVGASPAIRGQQVLVEGLLLSQCDYFVHTFSNVAMGVLLLNPKLKNFYVPSAGKSLH